MFRRTPPLASASVAPLAVLFAIGAVTIASAEVPTDPPVFTDPLTITNEYAPFVVHSVKTYRGKSDGERTVVVDLFTDITRTFMVGATPVDTRLLQETEFEDGKTTEISYNYFAQADDGTLYYFGEVVDIYEDGVIVAHDGSWLVGGPQLGDPPETATATAPAVFMPANPEVGDVFKPEDLFPIVDETVTVKKTGKKLKVEAGKFSEVIKVKETNDFDSAFEFKWYAKGIGVIATSAKGEYLDLIATTLLQGDP